MWFSFCFKEMFWKASYSIRSILFFLRMEIFYYLPPLLPIFHDVERSFCCKRNCWNTGLEKYLSWTLNRLKQGKFLLLLAFRANSILLCLYFLSRMPCISKEHVNIFEVEETAVSLLLVCIVDEREYIFSRSKLCSGSGHGQWWFIIQIMATLL